ncbi:MAG: diaminopimelate epimerase [Aquabacterium sp.]|jgi:diaminopimelate epimerase|uniref:diaminopimelate epimerase n=1 Tax=Aquabacterium sp. TaxID=1872578 RepID=UPI001B7BB070|nr:diaminopimelate epimerase [Aquabacterium sp.]MBP7133166.1 diaminopimelate epimerase [Aquabacterium sp.]MBP9062399.1 diaminopimelate epimerase [Aquabacterium sp.]MDQ5926478.1 diaminopimelate epimerase [Pseudomonadota bacterium]
MKLPFTKMHGAGNDFVVLDATHAPLALSPAQYRFLADRRFGIGADQILIVEPGDPAGGTDFTYRIMNADGGEVEQCGNGARCFARYVHDKGLTTRTTIRVQTMKTVIEPRLQTDGRVTVDMGAPFLVPAEVPFDTTNLSPRLLNGCELWPVALANHPVELAVVSMGNPHAVMRVDSVAHAPVDELGPQIESHSRFPRRVNAGFMEIVNRNHIRLRVYERGTGETLACGSGACAAVVAGIRLGWLDDSVDVDMPGGRLTIRWAGPGTPVLMTGPAVTVFDGTIDVPEL